MIFSLYFISYFYNIKLSGYTIYHFLKHSHYFHVELLDSHWNKNRYVQHRIKIQNNPIAKPNLSSSSYREFKESIQIHLLVASKVNAVLSLQHASSYRKKSPYQSHRQTKHMVLCPKHALTPRKRNLWPRNVCSFVNLKSSSVHSI